MPATAIDTLKYAQALERAGFSRQQAEAQAFALNEAINEYVATKLDLKELEMRLSIRLGAMMATCTAITLAALPLLIKNFLM